MNYLNKKTVEDIDVSGKKVLVRCDFNVPMKDGAITDTKRIVGALPTVKYLSDHGAKVILCSHMGRPHNIFNETVKLDKKEKKKIDAMPEAEQAEATAKALEAAKGDVKKFSLAPVAAELGKLLGKEVVMASDCIGPDAQAKAAALKDGDVMILENIRFHAEESKNDPDFAKALASLAEIYVNDAFGTAHRAHASTEGVSHYLPAVCGYLIQKEITVMGGALTEPKRPFVAILGGAKVSDKIGVIDNLISKVDTLIIGGGMAYTFLKSQGHSIGTSICEEDKLELAKETMANAEKNGVKFLLPVDTKVGKEFDPNTESQVVESTKIPEGWMGLDIGPKTAEMFADAVKNAGTVVWNGPMGVSEWENFAAGTISVAKAVAESGAISIIGGGDSAAAVEKLGFADRTFYAAGADFDKKGRFRRRGAKSLPPAALGRHAHARFAADRGQEVVVIPGAVPGHIEIDETDRENIADNEVVGVLVIEGDEAAAYKIEHALLADKLVRADEELDNHVVSDIVRQNGLHGALHLLRVKGGLHGVAEIVHFPRAFRRAGVVCPPAKPLHGGRVCAPVFCAVIHKLYLLQVSAYWSVGL